jgi:hypothetical protein
MKKLFFVISLLIYSASFTQQVNHPDYFEKYWTPAAGFVTQNYNDYYVFACTSLIATDSTYIGAGSLGLSAGWNRKTYAFSIQEQWKYYNWDQITEENDVNSWTGCNTFIQTLDGNYLFVTHQFNPGVNDDLANFELVLTKYTSSGSLIYKKKYYNSIDTNAVVFDVKQLKDSTILLSGMNNIYHVGSGLLLRMTPDGEIIDRTGFPPNLSTLGGWQSINVRKSFAYKDSLIVSFVDKNSLFDHQSYCKSKIYTSKNGQILTERFLREPDTLRATIIQNVYEAKKNEFISLTRDDDFVFANGDIQHGQIKFFLCYLDSNLHVKWSKDIRNYSSFPMNQYAFSVETFVMDTVNEWIYISGTILNPDLSEYKLFIYKLDYNGQFLFKKYFDSNYSTKNIDELTFWAGCICPNGDIAFSGQLIYEDTYESPPVFIMRFTPDGITKSVDYLGIEETQVNQNELGVYPNPSIGIFHLESLSEEPMEVEVYDQQGSRIQLEDQFTATIQLENQAPGIYFIHVKQGDQFWVKKVVKQ